MISSPFIETFTGARFQPLAPIFANIRIADMAHALSNQCRFSGHTRFHYSVAEHSVRVSELVSAWGYPETVAMWGLLHDGDEAWLVDLPSPVKHHEAFGAPFRKAQKRLMRAVCKRFGLSVREPKCVKKADRVILATEVRDLMFARPEHWDHRGSNLTEPPLVERIRPWAPAVAEFEFLRRFKQLGGTAK